MGPIKATLDQLHVLELCEYKEQHVQKFTQIDRVATFLNADIMVRLLAQWHNMCPCFVYSIKRLEPLGRDQEIEFITAPVMGRHGK